MLFYLEMNSESSVTADLDPPPRFKSASGYEPPSQIWTPPPPSPLPPLNFPFKHRLYHIW